MYKVLLFLTLFITIKAAAQTHIYGKITDTKNHALAGASIAIRDSYDGATSDSAGNYSFETTETGIKKLVASFSGYKIYEQDIRIDTASLMIHIRLKDSITELQTVVISAGSFEASDQKRATVLNPVDIVTTASANGDITSAIKTLPGTQQVGESEGLFVRGGTASETKYYIDGTLVNNFYYSSEPGQATRGRFNPFLFKGTIFSSGGYSALYGQALSSVLILESIDLPDKTSADFGLSYLGANAGFQKLSKNKRSSWGVTYSYANLALVYNLIKQKFDYFKVPAVHEADLNFRIKTSSTGMLKYYGYFNAIQTGFRSQDIDSLNMKDAFALKNFNMYHNLSWKQPLGKGWKLYAGSSFSTNRDQIKNEFQDGQNVPQKITDDSLYAYKNFGLDNKGRYANARLYTEKRLMGLSVLRFGGEYNYSHEDRDYTRYDGIQYRQPLEENLLAGYAEGDIYITGKLAARMGIRSEHSALLRKWNAAPRISLAYKFQNKGQASVAYGVFYQDPDSKNLPSPGDLRFTKATHYIAQYQLMTSGHTFRTELFYKEYKDLIKTGNDIQNPVAINNKGFGDAKGIEIFWRDRKTVRNVDYWVSYSYLDTKRDFLNYPFALTPSFAAKHTASLVIKKFITPLKTQFNASYTYASGRPYYNLVYDAPSNEFKMLDKGHAQDYNSLSLSVNYLPNIGKEKAKAFGVLVLSVTNVLGAKNIYTYNFSANGQHKTAVVPPSRRFYYVGYFISIGVDRTQDNINNHL